VKEPVFRRGIWWQQQDDGTWLRWNEGSQAWERSDTPPPPDDAGLPPMPPPPGLGMTAQYGTTPLVTVPVPNYMVWAILATVFCFLPTGIVAIVFASQVNSKLAAGDRAGAVEASNKAKTWTIVSVVVGVLFGIALFAMAGSSVTPDYGFGP
jgi:Interferon-induced transmembrane protein